MRDHKKKIFSNRRGVQKCFRRSLERPARAFQINLAVIGAGGDTKMQRSLRKAATHPKDKDSQRLLAKMLAAGFVATSGERVKRTAGGHWFWRETGTRPIVRLTSGGRRHGND
jgi:hypothetical protein